MLSRLAWLASSFVLTACGELIAADDYATAQPEQPYHGFFDRLGGAPCRECMLGICQRTIDQCAVDPACAEFLECYTTHPGMGAACSPPVSKELLELGHELHGCWDKCRGECNAGKLWSCNGAFEPPVPAPGVSKATILTSYFDDGAPIVGLDVRACPRDDAECAEPLSAPAPPTDEQGMTAIEVTWVHKSPLSRPGFDGYLEVAGSALDPPWRPVLRHPGNRVVSDFADAAVMFNAADPGVQEWLLGMGVPFDPKLPALAVEVHDCIGFEVPGVRFDVTLDDGAPVSMVYLDAKGELDRTLEATTTRGIAFAVNLSGTSGKVVARHENTGEVIRERAFVLRTGTATVVAVYPGAKGE